MRIGARTAAEWESLLGQYQDLARLVATTTGEDTDTAATRVWTALECLRKAGRPAGDPLILRPSERPQWTVFGSGEARVGVFATSLRDVAEPVVFAVLAPRGR